MNTCLLFGAGAEVNFQLLDGGDFAKKVLGINQNHLNREIREFYAGLSDEWYPKYHGTQWKENDLLRASLKKKWILESQQIRNKTEFEKYVKNSIDHLNSKQKRELLDKYTSYMGILDERFHALISPIALGPYKFWSVIACYWRAYLTLVLRLLPEYKNDIEWIMNNPIDAYDKMCLNAESYKEVTSYYNIISKYNKYKEIRVITTNYTPLCEKIVGLHQESIAYVNGSFKWFEQAKEMNILDVEVNHNDDFDNKDYFPFIFLQSGVKPIVCSTQIKEYGKAVRFLEECDKLIILGYKANCDDNHINSMIREFILKKEERGKEKEIIYFSFNDKINKIDLLKHFAIGSEQAELIKTKISIEEINEQNGYDKFEKCLSA